jgi:3D (Asp-Asp-Asp) domain-containing protein
MQHLIPYRPIFFSLSLVFVFLFARGVFLHLISPVTEGTGAIPGDNQNGTLNATGTFYFIPQLKHQEGGIDLLDGNERPTGFQLTLCDWCKAAIEGTVAISKNGKTTLLSYKGRSSRLLNDCRECPRYKNYPGFDNTGRILWQISSGHGLGSKNYKLVPYRTIAVDPDFIPLGTVVFIPAAVGIQIKEGDKASWTHDGYFFAADVGSKIVGNKIDFFYGFNATNPFPFVTSNARDLFSLEIVREPQLTKKYAAMHGK